jgi:hypothetical protein
LRLCLGRHGLPASGGLALGSFTATTVDLFQKTIHVRRGRGARALLSDVTAHACPHPLGRHLSLLLVGAAKEAAQNPHGFDYHDD